VTELSAESFATFFLIPPPGPEGFPEEQLTETESFTRAESRVRATLGRNVRRLRLSLQMTQMDLADRAKTRRALISDIERGETNAMLDSVVRIAIALNVDVAELFKPSRG
jgi:DNA-binding XRE family transcriptional regulator